MNNAGLRQARQSDPRKRKARDHDAAGHASQLAVSGHKNGIRDERWQFDHAFADAAQARVGCDDKRGTDTAADQLFTDGERAGCLQDLPGRARTDCKNGKEMIFLPLNFVIQSHAHAPRITYENPVG